MLQYYGAKKQYLKKKLFYSDKINMDYSKVLEVFLSVLKDSRVITIFVLVILYLNFVIYVTLYRKKPPAPKKKRITLDETPKKKEVDPNEEAPEI